MCIRDRANQTETIATWITRLEEVQGWVNVWVNSTQAVSYTHLTLPTNREV